MQNTHEPSRDRSAEFDRIHGLARRWLKLAARWEVARAQWDATNGRSCLYHARADEWGRLDTRLLAVERELIPLVLDNIGPASEHLRIGSLVISVALHGHDHDPAQDVARTYDNTSSARVSIVDLRQDGTTYNPKPTPVTT